MSDELLSVAEAARRYGLSEAKVRRMISLHELEGARKVRGATGLVWGVPTSAFEARGLTRNPPTPPGPATAAQVDLAELRRTRSSVTSALRLERQRLADKEVELQDALVQVRRLRRELRRERERREEAEGQLARLAGAVPDLPPAERVQARTENRPQVIDMTGVDRFALRAERGLENGD